MNRRELLGAGVLGAAALAAPPPSAKPAAVPRFAHEGQSIRELQALMTKGDAHLRGALRDSTSPASTR